MFRILTRRLFIRNSGVAIFPPNVRLAHGDPHDDESLTGIKRIFNGETVRGRANFAKLYLSMWAVIFVVYKFTKGRKAKTEPKPDIVEK